jgi:hypothetical protein
MDIFEFGVWCFFTLVCIKLDNKPIYEHLQDLKAKYNKFVGKEENIDDYVALNYME